MFKLSSRSDAPGVVVEPAEGSSDTQLVSSLILLVTGGVVSGKYERVERGDTGAKTIN